MTGDATRDNKPDSHHWGGPDEPMEDEYAQHAREERERKQRERQDAAHKKAKAGRTCLRIIPYEQRENTWTDTYCGRPGGHDGDCRPVPLNRKEGEPE